MIQSLLISTAIKIAANYLPTLATKLGGKNAAALAEDVVEAAVTTVGLGKDATPDQVMKALAENEQAQQELQIRLAELDAQEHERIVRDRESARAYQQAIGADGRRRGNYMLIGVTLGLLACVVMVAWPGSPASNNNAVLGLITTIAGALLKMFSDAFAFEFGSSRGSKEKDEQIRVFQEQLENVGRENASITRKVVNANVAQAVAPAAAALVASGGSQADAAQTVAEAIEKVEEAAEKATQKLAAADPGSEPDPDEPRPFVRALVEGRLEIGTA